MNIKKVTKQELLDLIEVKNNGLESCRLFNEKLEKRLSDAFNESRRHSEKVSELKDELRFAQLQGLADIKSISALIMMYETESMTHREKKYLGSKLRQVVNELIKERMAAIHFNQHINSDDIPF